ncbi:MAG: hypothetical protein RL375_1750 [Pseudomonadota bacterium]
MKRKLLVTLIASALELYAVSAGAGTCTIDTQGATLANNAGPVTTGPLNPIDGFPEYVSAPDPVAGGIISFQRCVDPAWCFFDPVVPTDPFSIQIKTGGEAFYWGADAVVDNQAGTRILTLVMAAETAFLEEGPNAEPINGSQFPFLRLRFVLNAPVAGTYTVRHPYGTNVFTVDAASVGPRAVFSTVDAGFAPNSTMTGPVGGPFLVTAPAWRPANLPANFVGDSGPNGTPVEVINSPCSSPADGAWNFVEVTAADPLTGAALDLGVNEFALRTTLFSVQGMLYDGRVQSPLSADRLTYSRSIATNGQIEAFASSSTTATVTVQDGPTIPLGTSRIATPVTLWQSPNADKPAELLNSEAIGVADASALPPIVSVTAADTSPLADPTVLNVQLVDFVDIAVADYDPVTGILLVSASSADQRLNPTLTLREYGDFLPGVASKLVATVAPPAVVHVDSAAGGTASAKVRVIKAILPAAPTGLAVQSATATTVTLSWTANSTNVASFSVYSVDGLGARTLLTTVPASASSAIIRNLTAGTTYTFVVDADSAAGAVASDPIQASTLSLPVAPTSVAATTTGADARTVIVSWVDNSADETSFKVERSTSATFATTTVVATGVATTGTGGTVTVVDSNGPPAANTTYYYRVSSVRGLDSSAPVASAGMLTPGIVNGTPVHNAVSAIGLNSVQINWTDSSTNETGFQVFRKLGASTSTNPYVAVGPVHVSSAGTGTARNYVDTGLTAGTQYTYRVDAINWAGNLGSATRSATTLAPVPTPTTLTAAPQATAGTINLTWTNVAGESGYLLEQSLDGGTNWTTVATTAVNVVTRSVTGLPTNVASYQFRVTALSSLGASAQAAPRLLTVPGLVAPATFTIVRGGNNNVAWTDSSGVESTYVLQRCTTNCTTTGTWTNVATFTSTTAQRIGTGARTLRYNMPAGTASYRMVPRWNAVLGNASVIRTVN